MHIFNWSDPCCFAFRGTEADLGALFVIDYTNSTHSISPWALDFILHDMNQ